MIGLSRHGFWEMLIGSVFLLGLTGLFLYLSSMGMGGLVGKSIWIFAAAVFFLVWVWLIAFFRDPHRTPPAEPNTWASPADGTVTDITPVENDPLLGEPGLRVGIFLSVFNVHVNRSPMRAKVNKVLYERGEFLDARNPEATVKNERNSVLLADVESGRPLAVVKQITGLIARRIVFPHVAGDVLEKGGRMGLIKFGSRTELLIPVRLKPAVLVAVGQKIKGCDPIVRIEL